MEGELENIFQIRKSRNFQSVMFIQFTSFLRNFFDSEVFSQGNITNFAGFMENAMKSKICHGNCYEENAMKMDIHYFSFKIDINYKISIFWPFFTEK